MVYSFQVASKRLVSSCSKQIIECAPLIRIPPQQHDPIAFLKTNLDVLKNESHKIKLVGFTCQDYSVTTKLNAALEGFCDIADGSMFGIATLSSEAIDNVQQQVSKYSESYFIRAFAVDCSHIAGKKENYKRFYSMFELCSSSGMPVFLITNEDNSFVDMTISAQTVCQMINDGIFDFCPNLKVVVKSSIVPLIISQMKSNDLSNSLQKNETKHYFRQNICMLANFSDEGYLNYLIGLAGDSHILLDSDEDHDISDFSQLTVSKIVSLNARQLLELNDEPEPLWTVNMDNVTILDKLNCVQLLSSKLRDKETEAKEFMIHADRLMTVLAEEALAMVPGITHKDIQTPTGVFQGLEMPDDPNLCVVSIIRSGDIILEAVRRLHPGIKVGKILVQRDEASSDKHAVLYYKKLPKDISECFVLLVDPMLATGGSLICAADVLVENGVKPSNILFVNLFSVEEGLQNVQQKFPEMKIITLSIDDYLNCDKYIVPGVGDFGDRYYGTQD